MKTTGMPHQIDALREMNGREHYALFMEMGTGKTWTILADAERAYSAGRIDGLLVVAPKGVHTNWIRREIPAHLACEHVAAAWSSGNTSRAYTRSLANVFAPRDEGEIPKLRILSMNIDALNTRAGYEMAEKFLLATRAMMVVDESTRIKSPTAARTKNVLALGRKAVMRRICSGMPVTNAPPDLFTQMEFLASGLLGTTSHRAFVAEYAELLPADHGLMRHITRNSRFPPQIVARNRDGTPRWRNLDRLSQLLAPHSYRVLKRECLSLPEKIYTVMPFELTPRQRAAYDQMARELRLQLGEEPVAVTALAALLKLQQITSGFVMHAGETHLIAAGENPRMSAAMEAIEDIDGKFIIWARFREEIAQLASELERRGIGAVQYHGDVSAANREKAVDSFQNDPAVRAFIGQPQSGGIGLTLTAAESVLYYSNDFNLETRLQSEDRAHRIGTTRNVVYIDLIAQDTIDERIVRALQTKHDVATLVMGDNSLDLFRPVGENRESRTESAE